MLGFYLALLDSGEEKSKFSELYLTYRQDMYKTAFAVLHSSQAAEDAVHEAFMIVIKKLNKISEINCPRTRAYLIIIVKNLALKMYNEGKRNAAESIDDADICDGGDVEADVMARLSAAELKELLLKLPEQYYQVLFLELYMELSISEAAESLGISYENAKKRSQRAKRCFSKMIKEHYGSEYTT